MASKNLIEALLPQFYCPQNVHHSLMHGNVVKYLQSPQMGYISATLDLRTCEINMGHPIHISLPHGGIA